MLFCSLASSTKNYKNNYKQLNSYEDKKLTVLSPDLSLSYRCLINYLKYNKLEINLNNINKYIKLFLQKYNYNIKYPIPTNIRNQYKQESSSVQYDKYFDAFINSGNTLLPLGMTMFSLLRSKTTTSESEFKLSWKHKLLILLVLLGIVLYYVITIESQCPILEEIKYMQDLKNNLKNITNIQELCIDNKYSSRSTLLSKMFSDLNNNYLVNKITNNNVTTDMLEYDLSCDLSLIISTVNNKDLSNNSLDVSNNNLENNNNLDISNNNLDVSNNLNVNNLDVSNNLNVNNLDVSNNLNNNNLDISNNICDIINNQEVISQEKIEDNNLEEPVQETKNIIKTENKRQINKINKPKTQQVKKTTKARQPRKNQVKNNK
jgi:hypothetical protein